MNEKPEIQHVNTFMDVIGSIDSLESDPDRHLSIQIDSSLRDAIKAAQTSGQPASITVKIKVKPDTDRRVTFSAGLSASLPRPPVSSVKLYADEFGCVHKSDPAQLKLPHTTPAIAKPKEN